MPPAGNRFSVPFPADMSGFASVREARLEHLDGNGA